MKSALAAAVLCLLAACSNPASSPSTALTSGVVEHVEPVELRSLSAPPDENGRDEDEDDSDRRYGDRVIVRLDDGRSVYVLYTGPRRLHVGEAVRVGLGESSAFIL